ncbi:MAG: HDIG domain-containing protein [Planctomycetes bacterium]|nr:HDIG domain-containing protein [Planctomycetota bacterium]
MAVSPETKKKRQTWHRLTFKHQRTREDILAYDLQLSHRVYRAVATLIYAAALTFLIGFGRIPGTHVADWAALAGAVLIVHGILYVLVRAFHQEDLLSVRRFLQLFLLAGLFFAATWLLLAYWKHHLFFVPLPLMAMALALVYSSMLAIHVSLGIACIVALIYFPSFADSAHLATQIQLICALFAGSVVGILGVRRIRTRKRLVIVGMASGAAQAFAILVFQLWKQDVPAVSDLESLKFAWHVFFSDPVAGFLNGLASGILMTSMLPYLESYFDVLTDTRLIELSDSNRPLLHNFSLLAPGSWQHSLTVGELAAEAARSIGANDLLARVGALYHDVGKMLKPNYFVENMREGENPHDRLSPEMSRLIIISHVKDGITIAEEEKLPQPIIDMIPMHHGTSVVEYFYNKKRMKEEEEGNERSPKVAFQYPGPRPTFREAGILMLADTTEAIARTLKDPSPAHLRTTVRGIIEKKMADNQLDECQLTVADLSQIEDAFVRVLMAIHHGRISYQDALAQDRERLAGASEEVAAAAAGAGGGGGGGREGLGAGAGAGTGAARAASGESREKPVHVPPRNSARTP